MAHTAGAALRLGVDEQKMEAVWEYRSSPLFSEAERVASRSGAGGGLTTQRCD